MTEKYSCTASELPGKLDSHMRQLRRDLAMAIEDAAGDSVPTIRERTPRAFGELMESAHVAPGPRVVLDAPHAAAVEVGSMPHMPDMEKLIAWVKLRGMQALHKKRYLSRLGPTTPEQATRVGEMLKARVVRANALGRGLGRGRVSPVDAPAQVAAAIARGIQKNGTKPHWFVRGSLPEIRRVLNRRIRQALKK